MRGFNHDSGSSESNHTCPTHDLSEVASQAFVGTMSFQQFNKILAGSCTAATCVIILALMLIHANHLLKPNEQLKIMKIAFLLPAFAIVSFLSICFPEANVYLEPWLKVVEASAMGTFFLLLCEFVSPSEEQRDVFFAAFVITNKKVKKNSQSTLAWYRRSWVMIFQYPVVALLVAIATDITEAAGLYCEYLSKPYFARLWLNIAINISLTFAFIAVIRFYMALKEHLKNHQPLTKLLAFKMIISLTFFQGILFWILGDTGALAPNEKLTYADVHIGIPNLVICIEMVPLSLFFHYAYSCKPYLIKSRPVYADDMEGSAPEPRSYQGGPLGIRAWGPLINPSEIIQAIAFSFKMMSEKKRLQPAKGQGDMYADDMHGYDMPLNQRPPQPYRPYGY